MQWSREHIQIVDTQFHDHNRRNFNYTQMCIMLALIADPDAVIFDNQMFTDEPRIWQTTCIWSNGCVSTWVWIAKEKQA